jgi:hypothetical protein
MRGSKTIHHFITKSGTTYKGQIIWNTEYDIHKTPGIKEDWIGYTVKLGNGAIVKLSNYTAKIKCGRNANIYYELSESGEQKIKKALGSAKKHITIQNYGK